MLILVAFKDFFVQQFLATEKILLRGSHGGVKLITGLAHGLQKTEGVEDIYLFSIIFGIEYKVIPQKDLSECRGHPQLNTELQQVVKPQALEEHFYHLE